MHFGRIFFATVDYWFHHSKRFYVVNELLGLAIRSFVEVEYVEDNCENQNIR